ncbi:hypothetical protein P8C59_004147 [Phyllachora maydis]|uniref:Uncharacterized protein n=1 Tax=Phyllachora maydis TaxID=1825666 RepID=A0AAD9MC57_9PEZI|nr:hypothetical protein P8C59_004147 [Phyllachora maydis]
MVVGRDVEHLLQTGSWQSARAKVSGPTEARTQAKEAVSLAKEYIRDSQGLTAEPTDEDPKHRGDVDQTPVILPVHEHNPERRFVLVPNSADDDKTEDGLDTQPQYDVNTCKRFVLVHPDEAASDSQVKAGEMNPKEEDNLPGDEDDYAGSDHGQETKGLLSSGPIETCDERAPIGCDFGTPPWYRIAYLMTLKYGYTDLRLLQAIAAVAARHQPCAGQRSATRIWHGLLDPANKRPIADFPVCHGCARTVEVLLPNLAGAFAPLDSASEPSKGMCELRFAPDRKRFLDYFDLLETASDRGLSRKAAPDLQHLADRVREISLVNECHRARPVPGRKWYVMKALPEFTVCEECFDEAVWPWQEGTAGGGGADDAGSQTDGLGGGTGSAIAWNFLPRMQQRQMAACQLYSERMRLAFRDACQRNDLGHLANVVRDRIQREEWMRARLTKLQREPPDDPRVQEEIARVVREWKLVE